MTRAAACIGVAALAALATVPACARPRPATAPPHTDVLAQVSPTERLRQDLQAIFTADPVNHAVWAVSITSLRTGESLFRQNPFRLLVPASNQKLLTTAVAAERLGWDFRYTTRLYGTAPVSPDGLLPGDLVVVADGDPTINPRHPERWTAFDRWAQALADQGLRRVTGHLVGDDRAFAEPGWAPGWSWDDLALGYGAPVTALQYHENQVDIRVAPGDAVGAPPAVALSAPGSGLTVDLRATTARAGEPTTIVVGRLPGSTAIIIRGGIAVDGQSVTVAVSVANPTRFYLTALCEALARHGISVAGGPIDIDEVGASPPATGATLLLEDFSPPLRDIIAVTLRFSRNLYAETLLRTLARPERPATADTGLAIVRDTLRRWGVGPEYFLARDGSGLSRYNWLSPDAVVGLLTYVRLNPALNEPYLRALPVSGGEGSLEERMKGTPAEGRVWAKTGSMSQVRALSGYLTTLEGEPLAFSILANGFRVPSRQIDEAVDQALVRLAAFTRSRTARRPAPSSAPRRPPPPRPTGRRQTAAGPHP